MGSSILELAAHGKADMVLRDMRVRSLWSPYYLGKVVLGYKELVDHLHYHDSELFITRLARGARRQWIEWPRGFFKSTQFTICTGIWLVCPITDEDTEYALKHLEIEEEAWFERARLHNQNYTQLLAYETDSNAKKKVEEIKWHFEQNTLFRACFPEIAYRGDENPWNSGCIKIRRTGYAERTPEGTFEAIGAGNALQSRHYDIVWEDDLVGKKAIESEVEMEKTIRWHSLLNGAFVDASKQIRFGVSNRWGFHDLNSHIREKEAEDWTFYTRRAWETGEDGSAVPIFPERYSIENLQEIRRSMSAYDFSCQYLNSPIAPGESEIDAKLLHTYRVMEDGYIHCSCGAKHHPSALMRYMMYDPYNAKGVNSKSRPARVVVGLAHDKHIFILDYKIDRANYSKIFEGLFEWNDQWRPHKFIYEDVGNQNMCEFYIRDKQKDPDHRSKHRTFPTIIPAKTGNRAKEIRIRDQFLPVLTSAKVAHHISHAHFTECLTTFPMPAPDHDYDLLDALASGAPHWRFPIPEDIEEAAKKAEDEYLAQLGKSYTTIGHRMEVRV